MRKFAYIWGIGGILYLLLFAIFRLAPHVWDAFEYHMSPFQWTLLALNVVWMGYSEGYKGFDLSFSPRVAARAKYLLYNASIKNTIFAPFFCVGYYASSRKTKIVVYALTFGILILIQFIRLLDTPWRGIVDAGVVFGLSWGIISVVRFCISSFKKAGIPPEADLQS